MLRRLYDWVLNWAETPYGTWALFILAFCESSFFPIPPDVLLIALAVGQPKKSLTFALVCSLGSVLGGCLGYLIGWQFMAAIGEKIIAIYGLTEKIDYIQTLYHQYDAWAIAIAGFTPVPYKVFTISAGAFKINFAVFIMASAISRSARFFLVGGLFQVFGPTIKAFIDKYFNILAIIFTLLIVAGFILLKYIL
jgi:membrane protein YqaA with SNARE-associated domain